METKEGSNPQPRSKVWRCTTPAFERINGIGRCRGMYPVIHDTYHSYLAGALFMRAHACICEHVTALQRLIQRCSDAASEHAIMMLRTS